MKMENLHQRREQLQSAELRLKQTILDSDKSIIVSNTATRSSVAHMLQTGTSQWRYRIVFYFTRNEVGKHVNRSGI